MTFGELLYKTRIEAKMTLRKFCEKGNYDSLYISLMERSEIAAPVEEAEIMGLAITLGILDWDQPTLVEEVKKEEYKYFMKLAIESKAPDKVYPMEMEMVQKVRNVTP